MSGPHSAIDRVARFRDSMVRRVREVNAITEKGVLLAGSCLGNTVDIARNYIGRVREQQAHAAGAVSDGLRTSIRRQSSSVEAYTRELCAMANQQSEVTNSTLAQVANIRRAEQEIARLARYARQVALNSLIEANRLGKAGDAFGVVAAEVKTLSKDIENANALVADLVDEMQKTLPVVAAQSATMQTRSEAFAKEHETHVREVERGVGSLNSVITTLLGEGNKIVEDMLEQSQQALSGLQFQDWVAQSLLSIDDEAYITHRELADELGVADAEIPPAAQPKLGGVMHYECKEAGAVELF